MSVGKTCRAQTFFRLSILLVAQWGWEKFLSRGTRRHHSELNVVCPRGCISNQSTKHRVLRSSFRKERKICFSNGLFLFPPALLSPQ